MIAFTGHADPTAGFGERWIFGGNEFLGDVVKDTGRLGVSMDFHPRALDSRAHFAFVVIDLRPAAGAVGQFLGAVGFRADVRGFRQRAGTASLALG